MEWATIAKEEFDKIMQKNCDSYLYFLMKFLSFQSTPHRNHVTEDNTWVTLLPSVMLPNFSRLKKYLGNLGMIWHANLEDFKCMLYIYLTLIVSMQFFSSARKIFAVLIQCSVSYKTIYTINY